jgi:transposase-like protein
MHWSTVFENFNELEDTGKYKLFRAIKQSLFGDANPEPSTLTINFREVRFNKGVVCVRCGCEKVRRNGRYKDRQRYICTDCGRTFNDLTHSPLARTWYQERMIEFFDLLVKGETLKKCAQRLRISMSTAFFWRHKILSSLLANDIMIISPALSRPMKQCFLNRTGALKTLISVNPANEGEKLKNTA